MKKPAVRKAGGRETFGVDSIVVLYLREPPAKVWGVIRSLDGTGVAVEGVDLRSFDELLRGASSGEMGPADLSLAFYPLGRVEKILMDRGTEAAPSLTDQFRARLGKGLVEYLKAAPR